MIVKGLTRQKLMEMDFWIRKKLDPTLENYIPVLIGPDAPIVIEEDDDEKTCNQMDES